MSAADITLLVFTLCNGLRVLAYAPQIAKAAKDNSGAQAISFATWGLFLFANVSAVAYALINKEDWMMAAMFIGNAAGCTAILLIAAWKRAVHRGRSAEQTSHEASRTAEIPRRRRDESGQASMAGAEHTVGFICTFQTNIGEPQPSRVNSVPCHRHRYGTRPDERELL